MKHTLSITLVLVGFFLLTQFVGLSVVNHYIDHKKTVETGVVEFKELPYNLEMDIAFNDNIATFNPAPGFSGVIQTFITANDSENLVASNLFAINVINAAPVKKFTIKNREGDAIVIIDESGDGFFTGNIFENKASINPTPNSFIIRNASYSEVAYINSSGSVFLLGTLEEFSAFQGNGYWFEIRNHNEELVAFFDDAGNLKLKGKAHEDFEVE